MTLDKTTLQVDYSGNLRAEFALLRLRAALLAKDYQMAKAHRDIHGKIIDGRCIESIRRIDADIDSLRALISEMLNSPEEPK